MTEQVYDVAILGGGPVGAALGLALSEGGHDVALLDAVAPDEMSAADFDGRAYAVALGSQRLLDGLGIWPRLAADAQEIRDIRVGEGAGSPSLLHFDPAGTGAGRIGWIVEDHHLRRACLAAVAGSEVRHLAPVEIGEIALEPTEARISHAGGTVRARLLVGADGRRSAVARAAGIGRMGWSYRQTGLVAAISHAEDHEGLAHQSFFPGGPFAVLPLTGRRCSIVWSERERTAEALMRADTAAYACELRRRIGDRLGALELIGRRWAYPLSLGLAERYAGHRVALVGDAAHGVHPIAGQGMNLGFRDVAALAEVIVEAGRLGEDIGQALVTERYEQWRRFDASAFALGMDGLNRLFSNGSWALGAVRRAGLSAVGAMPGALRALMTEATGQAGTVPRLLRGEPL